MNISKFLSKLGRFKWSGHNLIGHPISELLFLAGFKETSNWIHDITMPDFNHDPDRGVE